jgi:hypothetical protein
MVLVVMPQTNIARLVGLKTGNCSTLSHPAVEMPTTSTTNLCLPASCGRIVVPCLYIPSPETVRSDPHGALQWRRSFPIPRALQCWENFFFQTPNCNRTNKYWKLIKHKTLELISTASKQQTLEMFFNLKNLKLIASCNTVSGLWTTKSRTKTSKKLENEQKLLLNLMATAKRTNEQNTGRRL